MNTLQSIGIFGGSFDPVHNGHVLVARAALEELSLDRLFIVPAARSPFKPEQQPAAADVRLRLLRLRLLGDLGAVLLGRPRLAPRLSNSNHSSNPGAAGAEFFEKCRTTYTQP